MSDLDLDRQPPSLKQVFSSWGALLAKCPCTTNCHYLKAAIGLPQTVGISSLAAAIRCERPGAGKLRLKWSRLVLGVCERTSGGNTELPGSEPDAVWIPDPGSSRGWLPVRQGLGRQ